MRSGAAKVCPQCGEIKPLADFKDSSLVTGLGRFCRACKSGANTWSYHPIKDKQVKSENEPTKSDVNKLLNFSENPEKYATGTTASREKVEYLDNIEHKFSEGQFATYAIARQKYDAALAAKAEAKTRKADYSVTLREGFNNHKSVKIRYKGSWRTIDPYSLNETYVVAYCHLARDIRTFRVDRIQGAELSDSFNVDRSLQSTAQSRLVQAPSYKGYGGYRRRY